MPSDYAQVVAELLSNHLRAASAGTALLVGPEVESITNCLAASLSDWHFKTELNPFSAVTEWFPKDLHGCSESFETLCFINAFTDLSKLQRREVLALARDRLICCVLHLELEAAGEKWLLTDSLALGYRRVGSGQFMHRRWQLYEFDVARYKSTPRWLNADHWSNPEQWDRFRW